MAEVLRFKRVHKDFATPHGRVQVLGGVNFALNQGEFMAVTGPSGSGKSTLLNLASLLDQPTAGSVWFDGQDVGGLSEHELCEFRKNRVGMVFQKYCLLPHRSVLENILFRYRYLPHRREEALSRSHEAMAVMGLSDIADRPARLLSGGEMQRVSIARAVVKTPMLLVADEPTGNLDRRSAAAVMDCFTTLHKKGLTILFVTHNESLLGYCSRHLVCSDGVLQEAH